MDIRRLLERAACILYPKRCPGCGEIIYPDEELCDNCAASIRYIPESAPEVYGLPFSEAAARVYYAGAARNVIKLYKFKGWRSYAVLLSEWMAEAFRERYSEAEFDAVVSVPVAKAFRKSSRFDYNAELVGRFAETVSLEYRPELLIRIRENERQTRFGAKGRLENMRGVFTASPEASGLRLLVADDIITTGATMAECARALFDGGALSADVLAVAATQFDCGKSGRDAQPQPLVIGP